MYGAKLTDTGIRGMIPAVKTDQRAEDKREGMMDETQVIQDQVDAFNARDLERFLSFYHPDVVVEDGAGNVMMQGHDGLRGFYGSLFERSPELHVDVLQRIHIGSRVIDEEHATGAKAEGFPSELHAAVVYRVADGKIVHVRLLM